MYSSTRWTLPSMCFPSLSRGSQIYFAERNVMRKFDKLMFGVKVAKQESAKGKILRK